MRVHRFWTGPARPQHLWITAVVHHLYPDVTDWTPDTLPPDLSGLLDLGDDPRHLSNVVRYWLLHEYGGLYLDYDVIPLRDLTGSPHPWTASLYGHREGSSMWFPVPGHPMLAELVTEASARGPDYSSSPRRSGAKLLHRVGLNYPDVAYEPRVLPIDALGRRVPTCEVWAVGQWQTSSRNLAARLPAT